MKRAWLAPAALAAVGWTVACNPPITGAPCTDNSFCPTDQVCIKDPPNNPNGKCEMAGGPGGGSGGSGGSGGTGGTGGGAGLKANGQPCAVANECQSGACQNFFRDEDNDTVGGPMQKVCGSTPPAGFQGTGGDCCDTDPRAKPGQTMYFDTARTGGCAGPGFDFDCDNQQTLEYPESGRCYGPPAPNCNQCALGVGWAMPGAPMCGSQGQVVKMVMGPFGDGGCPYTNNSPPVTENAKCR